jgi:hypothetical protein
MLFKGHFPNHLILIGRSEKLQAWISLAPQDMHYMLWNIALMASTDALSSLTVMLNNGVRSTLVTEKMLVNQYAKNYDRLMGLSAKRNELSVFLQLIMQEKILLATKSRLLSRVEMMRFTMNWYRVYLHRWKAPHLVIHAN